MADKDPVFGDVIYSYTRKQAIEDGVLVDITEMAKEAGSSIPWRSVRRRSSAMSRRIRCRPDRV
jgi:type I site-specific restriction-modification system R (restriction) subunit